MDDSNESKRVKPIVRCPQRKDCDQTNPIHFMEYAHQHLDEIIEQNATVKNVKQFKLPDDLVPRKKVVLEQIKAMKVLFKNQSDEPKAKRIKLERNDASTTTSNLPGTSASFVQPIQAVPSTSTSETKPKKKAKDRMTQKLASSRPYNFFLTCVTSSPPTHTEDLSITFLDILHESLGELECSVQMNYTIEADWLFSQYSLAGHMEKPLLIIYGDEKSVNPVLSSISQTKPQVTAHRVRMSGYGSHHTKIMLLGYKDGSMRVVVGTANLVELDWNNHTHGVWISEKLEQLPAENGQTTGESVTGFRKELVTLLASYKLRQLQAWITRIQNTNFEPVNVFLVTSIPGDYRVSYSGFYEHGCGRASEILSKHCAPINESSQLVAQCSALGKYGTKNDNWITGEFAESFHCSNVRIIYPSLKNVENSHDGLLGGNGLHYDNARHNSQKWLNDFLYQWKADCRHRSQAMPHIKTYCRLSENKMFWFMLTSANLSRSAWGYIYTNRFARYNYYRKRKNNRYDYGYSDDEDDDDSDDDDDSEDDLEYEHYQINNYEAGVLFLPKFVTKTNYFSMDEADTTTPVFPKLYDIPLTKYALDDKPFMDEDLLKTQLNNVHFAKKSKNIKSTALKL